MFIGTRKFFAAGGFTSQTAVLAASGSTNSGIGNAMGGFGGSDPSGHVASYTQLLNDNDLPTVTNLAAGRILTIDITGFTAQYQTGDSDPGGDNDRPSVSLSYGKITDAANAVNIVSEAFANITSQVPGSYQVIGGNRIYTNNFSTYSISFNDGNGTSGSLQDQTALPIRFFTRRRILAADISSLGQHTSGIGLIATYSVVSRGNPTSAGMSITIREGVF